MIHKFTERPKQKVWYWVDYPYPSRKLKPIPQENEAFMKQLKTNYIFYKETARVNSQDYQVYVGYFLSIEERKKLPSKDELSLEEAEKAANRI